MKKFTVIIFAALAVAVIQVACGPSFRNEGSEEKSIDNYGQGGYLSLNSCVPNRASYAIAEKTQIVTRSQKSRAAVISAVGAVPKEFLATFQALKGKVVATPDAKNICDNATGKSTEKNLKTGLEIPSCWRQTEIGEGPEIIVSDDPAIIRHSMVRAFTYFFTQYFLPRASHPDAPKALKTRPWKDAIAEFETVRTAVTKAFLADVSSQNPERAKVLKSQYEDKDQDSRTNLSNDVLAEVLDSCYCSSDTRKSMQLKYPKTWAASACTAKN